MVDDETPGDRVKEYVDVAIARSKRVHSMADLIRATGFHPNTIYDIFNGTTKNPGTRVMSGLAAALDCPVGDLWARWEGREIEPDSFEDALRRHTIAVDQQNRLLGELVGYIRSSARAIIEAGGDNEHVLAAQVAIDAARADQPEGSEADPPSEPDASAPPRRLAEGTRPRSLRPQPDR